MDMFPLDKWQREKGSWDIILKSILASTWIWETLSVISWERVTDMQKSEPLVNCLCWLSSATQKGIEIELNWIEKHGI